MNFRNVEYTPAMVILSLFNQQIVLCQDDAYILTGYGVGNEVGGEAA